MQKWHKVALKGIKNNLKTAQDLRPSSVRLTFIYNGHPLLWSWAYRVWGQVWTWSRTQGLSSLDKVKADSHACNAAISQKVEHKYKWVARILFLEADSTVGESAILQPDLSCTSEIPRYSPLVNPQGVSLEQQRQSPADSREHMSSCMRKKERNWVEAVQCRPSSSKGFLLFTLSAPSCHRIFSWLFQYHQASWSMQLFQCFGYKCPLINPESGYDLSVWPGQWQYWHEVG